MEKKPVTREKRKSKKQQELLPRDSADTLQIEKEEVVNTHTRTTKGEAFLPHMQSNVLIRVNETKNILEPENINS